MAAETVHGVEQLVGLLNDLPAAVEKRVLSTALRAGARVVLRAARARILSNPSVDTRSLYGALGIVERKKSTAGGVVVSLGARRNYRRQVVRRGRKKPSVAIPAMYLHFLEFGTRKMPAEPILRPAIDETGEQVLSAIIAAAGRGIDREIGKLAAGKISFVTGTRLR